MATLASYDPSNGEQLGEVPVTPLETITEIVAAAHKAAKSWSRLAPAERVDILAKAYAHLDPIKDDLSVLLCREMGKDIRRASGEVRYVVGKGAAIAQSVVAALEPRNVGGNSWVEYKPLGVTAVISPWNYPVAMAHNLIVPALAAGNTVVFKPSEETPLVAKVYADRLNEVLPPNVLQVIYGDGEQGQTLVESDVNMIAFTGSQATGKKIMASSSSQLKRLVMELGGNDPLIVMSDADIEAAAQFAVANSVENSGQMCIATERIYVDDQIAEDFEKRVVEVASEYKVGPWDMEGVNVGPIINAKQHRNVVAHIEDAAAKGARILLGGVEQPKRYINPTVIADVTPEMIVERQETFGPVVAISRYRDIGEAIERANRSSFGLGAVVFGGDEANAVADDLEAGMVGVNQGVGAGGDAPWVGAKQSGYGFRNSPEGHRQFAQVRVVNR